MRNDQFNRLIIVITMVLFAVPPLVDLARNGFTRVFTYFAADTFYYLTVARNFASFGSFTFDQQLPTNGFHPLWQVLLGFLYQAANALGVTKPGILSAVMVLNILFLTIAIFFFAKSYLLETPRLSIAFVLLSVGIYPFITLWGIGRNGSLWNYINGMESSLVVLSYALAMWVMVRSKLLETFRSAIALGVIFAFLFLARLDHAFFIVAFGILMIIRILVYREWYKIKYLAVIGIVVGIVLVGYLAINYFTVGAWLPVSGSMKSTFPRVIQNKFVLLAPYLENPMRPDVGGVRDRLHQIIIPMLAALVYFIWSLYILFKRRQSPLGMVLAITALFILIMGLYEWLYVPLGDQGSWYFPISVPFLSLLIIYFLNNRIAKRADANVSRMAYVWLSIACVFVLWYFATIFGTSNYQQYYAKFYMDTAQRMLKNYPGQELKIVEFDDGIIGFATDYPTLSGFGFTLDVEGVKAKSSRKLLALAYSRGFNRIASMNYFNARGLELDTPSDVIKERLAKTFYLNAAEVEPFNFQIEFISPEKTFAVIKMTKSE